MAAQLIAWNVPLRPEKRWMPRATTSLPVPRLAEDDRRELGRRDALDVGGDLVHLRAADELGERASPCARRRRSPSMR